MLALFQKEWLSRLAAPLIYLIVILLSLESPAFAHGGASGPVIVGLVLALPAALFYDFIYRWACRKLGFSFHWRLWDRIRFIVALCFVFVCAAAVEPAFYVGLATFMLTPLLWRSLGRGMMDIKLGWYLIANSAIAVTAMSLYLNYLK